jgi:CDP-glycerol glycerophosphotransferase
MEIGKIKKWSHWFLKESPIILLVTAAAQIAVLQAIFRLTKVLRRRGSNLICFTGMYYNDNSKAMFEMVRKNTKYECYWIARNKESLKEAQKDGGVVFYYFTPLLFLNFLLKTKLVVTSTSFFPLLFPEDCKVLQLWHGVSPKPNAKDSPLVRGVDICCVPTEQVREKYVKWFNVPVEMFRITGYPRLDTLLAYIECRNEIRRKLEVPTDKKVVLYAPTWNFGVWGWDNPYKNLQELAKYLNEKNVSLIFRFHPLCEYDKTRFQRKKFEKVFDEMKKEYSNVFWLDMDQEQSTEKLLAISDVLITDWSSIYTDYYVTKNPVIFLEWEKETFLKMGGLKHEWRVGDIATSKEEFYKILDNALEYENRYEKEQQSVLNKIHGKVDGKASQRVLQIIEEMMNG